MACTARQSEDILVMKKDLFGYDRYRIPCKYLSYSRIDLGLNRLVILPPDYIRRVGTPSNSSDIQYNPTKTQDVGYYVDQTAQTCLNRCLYALCHHPHPVRSLVSARLIQPANNVFLSQKTSTSTNHRTGCLFLLRAPPSIIYYRGYTPR